MSKDNQETYICRLLEDAQVSAAQTIHLLEEAERAMLEHDQGGDEDPGEGDDDGPEPDHEPIPYGSWPPPAAMVSGPASDPKIAPLLEDMEAYLASHEELTGAGWSPREICTMPKAPGRPVAIPVRGLWHHMVPTLALYEELRELLGQPCSLRGYRPPDYNAAVGGASRSAHLWFAALDVYAPVDHRRDLAELAAGIFAARPDLEVGLGIYGYPHSSNIHIDVGAKGRRTWADTQQWLSNAK